MKNKLFLLVIFLFFFFLISGNNSNSVNAQDCSFPVTVCDGHSLCVISDQCQEVGGQCLGWVKCMWYDQYGNCYGGASDYWTDNCQGGSDCPGSCVGKQGGEDNGCGEVCPCTYGNWYDLWCAYEGDGSGCSPCSDMFQARNSTNGCEPEYRCDPDPATCGCGGCSCEWIPGSCGVNGCSATQRYEYEGNCVPDGCSSGTRCVDDPTCNIPTPTPTPTPVCSFNNTTGIIPRGSPTPYPIPQGETRSFIAYPSPTNGTIDYVAFSSSNTSILNPLPPTSPASAPYSVNYQAVGGVGLQANYTARAFMGGVERCLITGSAIITNPPAWWQVVNGDVFTPINLDSEVLTGQYFYQTIAGGFPGVPFAGNILINPSRISENYGWNAETAYGGDIYNFAYFKQKVADVYNTFYELTSNNYNGSNFATRGTNWPVGSNYYWAKATANPDGSLTITGTVGNWPANRKVILFVERNGTLSVNINKVDINLGTNLFMVITNGRIIYPTSSSGVQEGIYFADQKIITETTGNSNDSALNFFGSFIGWGGFELNRSLPNNVNPAETFTFSPAQVMQIPVIFGKRSIIWKEVAP